MTDMLKGLRVEARDREAGEARGRSQGRCSLNVDEEVVAKVAFGKIRRKAGGDLASSMRDVEILCRPGTAPFAPGVH